ncbi:MAG: carbon-nitrogen hydrolase family protein [Candidatus Methanolliviera hydrocarbonicum]|uniref:Carbon-nitrogen hydrolase family protein n=1 Tax=Candidatus Methanolliviera hydrocarbonicum TaxID=2491085 RepID=A0A520KZ69_9EURY|nr:MAG: carbon-nitrogen hydrolase family protein [Candidatus Methanolliviera hydrocarbonicum]
MRINIAQINYDPTDIGRLEEVLQGLDEGVTCFPECFALGRISVDILQYLNRVSDEREKIVDTVKNTGKTVILPLIEKHPIMKNRFYNTTYVIHNEDVIGTYRRVVIHPMEKPFVQAGNKFPVFKIGGVAFGILVCFEIAFPELSRIIALKGASVIFAPASSPEEADYLWKTRLRGRAVDNQLFMVGVNRWGDIGNEIYLGKSLVISPSGRIVHESEDKEEISSVEIDLDEISLERGKEPTFSEFEIGVYDKSMGYFKGVLE